MASFSSLSRLRPMSSQERIFGLDLLRAVAVLLVVFHHSIYFLNPAPWVGGLGWVGEIGVGSLLVLSGYLIGLGLIRKLKQGEFHRLGHLSQFYLKRWARTLPAYYFFLGMMAALFPPIIAELIAHKEYFVFMQNFAWNTPHFYAQTWTLTLLEFFYLLFPLLLLLASKFVRHYLVCIAVPMLVLFFIPVILRSLHTEIETREGFEETFRKWIIYRLDTPIIGVVAALVYTELPLLWAWFLRHFWIGLCSFSLLVIYHYFHCPYLYSYHWLQVFFFPLSAIMLLPLLPLLCSWKSNLTLPGLVMSALSQSSYSLYVSHFFALYVGFYVTSIFAITTWYLAAPIYLALIAVITCGGYYLTEEPFMRLREKSAPSLLQRFRRFSSMPLGTPLPSPVPVEVESQPHLEEKERL
jgi:peptidoglycan/LPS O-acetylase OafA/YrhL